MQLLQKPYLPWALSIIVAGLAVFVWGDSLAWRFSDLSIYQVFPLLGLLAFSIMWSHYMAGFMHKTFLKNVTYGRYYLWTSYAVLVAILLHPGLLAYQRYRDGFGLPPSSETSYVMPGLGWIVVLGMTSLLVFLAFELHRWFDKKSWWQVVPRLGDAAMVAIFYHGLRLGTQTHITWFRTIWIIYGVTLILVLLYSYALRIRKHSWNV